MRFEAKTLGTLLFALLVVAGCGDDGANSEVGSSSTEGEGDGDGDGDGEGEGEGDCDGDGDCAEPMSMPGPTIPFPDWPQEPGAGTYLAGTACTVTSSTEGELGLDCIHEDSMTYGITFGASPLPVLAPQTEVTLSLECQDQAGGDAEPSPRAQCQLWGAVVRDDQGIAAVIVNDISPKGLDTAPLQIELTKPCGEASYEDNEDVRAAVRFIADDTFELMAGQSGEVGLGDATYAATVQVATLYSCCHFPSGVGFSVARQ